jgi:thymidine kinase
MGKTTLLLQFLQHIRESARTVFLFQTQCNTRELFRYLLYDLGINPAKMLPKCTSSSMPCCWRKHAQAAGLCW